MDIGATRLTLSDLAVNATITEVQHVGQSCALSCASHCMQGLVVVEVIPTLALKFEVIIHQQQGSASDLASVDQAAVFAEPPGVRGDRQSGAIHGRHVLLPLRAPRVGLCLLREHRAQEEAWATRTRPQAGLTLAWLLRAHFFCFLLLVWIFLVWLVLNRCC